MTDTVVGAAGAAGADDLGEEAIVGDGDGEEDMLSSPSLDEDGEGPVGWVD